MTNSLQMLTSATTNKIENKMPNIALADLFSEHLQYKGSFNPPGSHWRFWHREHISSKPHT